jgi:hypothetical protein
MATEYARSHGLIEMMVACAELLNPKTSPMKDAIAHDLVAEWEEIVGQAFAEATVNAKSTLAYALLPDAGAYYDSKWDMDERRILAKANVVVWRISLENPDQPLTVLDISRSGDAESDAESDADSDADSDEESNDEESS